MTVQKDAIDFIELLTMFILDQIGDVLDQVVPDV